VNADRTGSGSRGAGADLRAVLACCLAAAACAGSGGRDVVPETHDVVTETRAAGGDTQGYEYVARRPLAVVALAEARGIESVTAHAAVDRLADRLDACITDKAREGGSVEGAARVIARIDATGAVAATQVRVDPGGSSASNAVVCLVAPMKLLAFPPAETDGRGIAIEAIWGHVAPAPAPGQ
jgi:hypothetical protein